ncbi:tagatose 6-phosphate kinase [Streptacidiphilus sp. MAP12-20]|uniref:1-phosphofructokinase family hexose kinase n=1 Tax=Streptacidiphilus sp. MAP12-20 TaxID=3156299 RepID=UPI003512B857
MIVTVTLNAALDVTYVVDGVTLGATHRVRSVAQRAGGKGVNAARVLAALGEPALALGLAGGATGDALRAELAASGVPHRLTPIAGATRRAVAVVDAAAGGGASGGGVTGFWEPGPMVTAEEFERFVRDDFLPSLATARAVVLSGSLPPGVPVDAYARLVRLAADAGVPALVDADGPALRAALGARPALVKPNAEEARRALGLGLGLGLGLDDADGLGQSAAVGWRGHDPDDAVLPVARDARTAPLAGPDAEAARLSSRHAAESAARPEASSARPRRAGAATPGVTCEDEGGSRSPNASRETFGDLGSDSATGTENALPSALARALVAAGARAAVVSAGPDGLAADWGGEALRAVPPRLVAGNPTGAGDAASAALALALARRQPPAEALAEAVALSAAAVAAPLAGDFDAELYAELRPLVAVRAVVAR